MDRKNKNKEQLNRIEILENVKVFYINNSEEQFEAVQITKKGLKYGRKIDNKFLFYGFIPLHNIKEIKNRNIKKNF